ncbi:LAQU0S12e01200g1_1 [Lachancea quebecensis]|uniref:LAQU0S12e01200g1_1 n=1 Tax=Lachancea quebecensis TaxID=1654605 RepID=A0A0P1KWW8_9SACH|nr:LAQU0S12e01200g1_1 [Lachancea quebecensis]
MALLAGQSQVDQAVDYIINALSKPDSSGDIRVILNNLVYYVPRLRSKVKLDRLVRAMFRSRVWESALQGDLILLQESSEAIFSWKLEISEPVISVNEFYEVWDNTVTDCSMWSAAQISIIGGALKTRNKFKSLQTRYFLDERGLVAEIYARWKRQYFLPLWRQIFLQSAHKPKRLRQLAIVLSAIFSPSDSTYVPCDVLCEVLTGLSISYIQDHSRCEPGLPRNISGVANTLEATLQCASKKVASRSLKLICTATFELSLRELNNPKQVYSSQVYSDQLLTVVLLLRGCITRPEISDIWYLQAIMSLYYMNFILQDFGRVGFESYEFIYEVCATALKMKPESYTNCLEVMRGNLWPSVMNNAVNDSRALFLLTFIESTVADMTIDAKLLNSIIVPTLSHFVSSPNTAICESAHAAQLSLYSNHVSPEYLQKWKCENCLKYLDLSTNQFLAGFLSSTQVIQVYTSVVREAAFLQPYNDDLVREILHFTYLRILNAWKMGPEIVTTLIECLVVQIPHVSQKYIIDWLDNCLDLINNCGQEKEKLLDHLWLQLTSNEVADVAFGWWYENVVRASSKL